MGMGAGAATYGIMQAHYYWIGAIPAMVFVALFMIPFYYASRVHSVPGSMSWNWLRSSVFQATSSSSRW